MIFDCDLRVYWGRRMVVRAGGANHAMRSHKVRWALGLVSTLFSLARSLLGLALPFLHNFTDVHARMEVCLLGDSKI